MAPTPPTTTRRVKAFYTGPYGEHVMLFHGKTGCTTADLLSSIADFIDPILELQYTGTSWNRVEVAAPGSTLFFPDSTWVTQTSTSTSGTTSSQDPAAYLNFAGRGGTDGKRVRLFLFETYIQGDNQMRIQAAENANIANAVNALNDEGSCIGTISGSIPVWKEYANLGSNDYLVRKARNS